MKTATRGCYRTLKATQKYRWEHFWGSALGDRAPTDPKGVPRDQNFWSKIFGPKFFSYHPHMMFIYVIFRFISKKLKFI